MYIHYTSSTRKLYHIRVLCPECRKRFTGRFWVTHMLEEHGIEAKIVRTKNAKRELMK